MYHQKSLLFGASERTDLNNPLAGLLLRLSVTSCHLLSEQEFAASFHKQPVVLSISFNTSVHPLTVEQNLQDASRCQGDQLRCSSAWFPDAIAPVVIQKKDSLMKPLLAHHSSCVFCSFRRMVRSGMIAVSPTGRISISRGVSPVGVGVSASCSMRAWCSSIPSVTSSFSSSVSCTNSNIRSRFAWPSRSWSASDS